MIAMTMADKIVVLNRGNVEQVGSPLELYTNPCNLFVAGFIGSPKMNFLSGAVAKKYQANTIGVRPEHLTISKDSGELRGTAGVSEHLGSDTFVHVKLDNGEQLTARGLGDYRVNRGEPVYLTPVTNHVYRFDQSGLAIAAY
jgi:multiple sugar transport system ATP-binding protein